MHRLVRFAGTGSNLIHAAGGVQVALTKHFASLSILPNSSVWPFHLLPEGNQQASQTPPQSSADIWQSTKGLAISVATTDTSHQRWGSTPALPSQLQAAAELAQIQQMSGIREADLGAVQYALCK